MRREGPGMKRASAALLCVCVCSCVPAEMPVRAQKASASTDPMVSPDEAIARYVALIDARTAAINRPGEDPGRVEARLSELEKRTPAGN